MNYEITVKQIIELLGQVKFIGNPDTVISDIKEVSRPEDITQFDLCWLNEKSQNLLFQIKSGTVICPDQLPESFVTTSTLNLILVAKPRQAFMQILQAFFVSPVDYTIAPSSYLHFSVKTGHPVSIGHNVVIEEGVSIGAYTRIDSNSVIKKNSRIGDRVIIGANCTIGSPGFGYEKNIDGAFEHIPHIGNVIIEDDVEIGNNVCIDQAVIGSTLIESNSKINNFVHIAHGSLVGENSIITAHVMIAGSVKIGKNAWIAPCAAIRNKIKLGDNVTVGMGAVVVKDVESNTTVVGNPAKLFK